MTRRVTITYLNDHLAGAVAALELLDHLLALPPRADQDVLSQLRGEIQQDQKVLQGLLQDFGGKETPLRKAAAWLTEKMGQIKLRMDDPGSGELFELETLEALALGIHGKLSLWRALAAVADRTPGLFSVDLGELQARAKNQFDQVERLRLEAASRALGE
jgi:hypothetical protein